MQMQIVLVLFLCMVSIPFGAERSPHKISAITEHFEFACTAELEPNLSRIASVAEAVYDSLSAFYRYHLPPGEKFRVILEDEEDYSNGFAIGFAGWVTIYLAPADFVLRGNPGWEANVLAHELSHLVSLRKLGYTSRYLGHSAGFSLQKKRGMISAATMVGPDDLESWLVEGLAQLGAEMCGLDRWDAVRAALERETYFAGYLPPLLALKTFHQDSRRAELLYNQGYSFLRWARFRLGAQSWGQMIDSAALHGLKESLAQHSGMSFADLFQAWRTDRALRHEAWGSQDSVPGSAHYRVDLKTVPTQEGIWSVSSWPNDHGMLRLFNAQGTVVDDQVTGALWVDAQGKELLWVSNRISTDNVRRNQLVQYSQGTAQVVPHSERVLSACRSQETLWVIRHSQGRNEVGSLDEQGFHLLVETPAGLEPMELTCWESLEGLAVSANHGQGRALYFLLAHSGAKWQKLVGEPMEDARNPMVWHDSLFFAWDQGGVFQIYSMDMKSLLPRPLTQERGGAYHPWRDRTALRYSAFRMGSFVPAELVDPSPLEPGTTPGAEAPLVAPMDSFATVSVLPAYQSADRLTYLGFYTMSNLSMYPEQWYDSVASRRVVSYQAIGGLLLATPSLRNMLELQAGAVGFRHSAFFRDEPGPFLGLGWSTQDFTPDISTQVSYMQLPIYLPDSLWEDSGEESDVDREDFSPRPWISVLNIATNVHLPLNDHWSVSLDASYLGMGVRDSKLTRGYVITFMEQAVGALGLQYASLEYGRRHPNSGMIGMIGPGVQWWGVVPVVTGYQEAYPFGFAQSAFFGNIGRVVFLGFGMDGMAMYLPASRFDEETSFDEHRGWNANVGANASLDIALPWRVSGIGRGAPLSHALTAWELHLGYGVRWTDSLLIGTSSLPALMAQQGSFRQSNAPNQAIQGISQERLQELGVLRQSVEAALRWEALTFSNSLAQWELGVSFPARHPEDWMLYVGIAF